MITRTHDSEQLQALIDQFPVTAILGPRWHASSVRHMLLIWRTPGMLHFWRSLN